MTFFTIKLIFEKKIEKKIEKKFSRKSLKKVKVRQLFSFCSGFRHFFVFYNFGSLLSLNLIAVRSR